jgi:hypothetical protein
MGDTLLIALKNHLLITYENKRIRIAHNTIRTFARSALHEDRKECAETMNQFIDYCMALEGIYYGLGKDYDREVGEVITRGLTRDFLEDLLGFDVTKDFYRKYSSLLDNLERLYAVKLIRDSESWHLNFARIKAAAHLGSRFVPIKEFQTEFDKIVKSSLNETEQKDFFRKAARIAKIADALRIVKYREFIKNFFIHRDEYFHPYSLIEWPWPEPVLYSWDGYWGVWDVTDKPPEYSFFDRDFPAETHACLEFRDKFRYYEYI